MKTILLKDFVTKAENLIADFQTLIDPIEQTGNICSDCQKLCIQQALSKLERTINGTEQADLKGYNVEETLYILSENAINEITINEKIANKELFEYTIIDREDFVTDLIRWISEAKESDKTLMIEDLKMLLRVEDDYILSSISTNDYLYNGCSEFNNTCKELLKLNKTI